MIEYERGGVKIVAWPDYTKDDVEAVVNNLRASDRHELRELGVADEDMAQRCRSTVGTTPLSYMVYLEGRPVFMWGVTAMSPRFMLLWGFGTEDTRRIIPTVTRHVRRTWLSEMAYAGVSRIEARLPSSCRDSLQWLKSCGMREETELLGLSSSGAPFSQLSLTFSPRSPADQNTDTLHVLH